MTPLTVHLSVEQFACHSGEPYPVEWIDSRLVILCAALEAVLEDLDTTLNLATVLGHYPVMTIVSGYRTSAHNRAVGGAEHSRHMMGDAADVTVEGVPPVVVHAAALRLSNTGAIGIGGLGLYPKWAHIDVRPMPASGHLAQWTGRRIGDEQVA